MTRSEAIQILLSCAEIRRDQWLAAGAAEPDEDISSCITELYEATPDECASMAKMIDQAMATILEGQPTGTDKIEWLQEVTP